MVNIVTTPEWKSVRILEQEELALGGANGNMNEQAIALVARSEFLKQRATYQYATLALANADIASINLNQNIFVSEAVNGGYWYKATAGATTLTKSPYDPLEQAKADATTKANAAKSEAMQAAATDATTKANAAQQAAAVDATTKANTAEANAKAYTNAKTNLNLFKGFNHNSFATGVVSAYKLEQTNSSVVMDGGRLQLTLPVNGKLTNTCSVWANVTNAVLGAGVMRALVQVRKKDATTAHSNYYNVPNGTIGWYKLVDVNLSAINPSDIDAVIVNPEATGGAILTLADVYVGESTPNTTFTRINKIDDDIIRSAVKTNLIPKASQLPIFAGVTYSEERISISAGVAFDYTIPISDKQILYFSVLLNQVSNRDTRFRFLGTPTDGSAVVTRDIYTSAVNGMEFSSSVDFGKPVKQVQLKITSLTANAVFLDRLLLSYDPVLQSKRVSQVKLPSSISDLIDDTSINLTTFPFLDYLTAQTGDVVRSKDSIKIANGGSVSIKDSLQEIGAVTGDVLYVNLIGSNVLNKTGTVIISQTQITAANAYVGGSSATLVDGTTYQNIPVTIRSDAVDVQITVKATGDSEVYFVEYSLSRKPIYNNSRVLTLRAKDLTGVTVSNFSYPKLTGYDVIGEAVSYSRSKDANGDYVLTVPVTAATGNGQGARWAIKYDAEMLNKGANFSIQLASTSFSTVKAYIAAKTSEGGIVSEVSLVTLLKNDGSWTTWFYRLPAKHTNGNTITEATITFYQASTATAPLKIKRPLLSADMPNQFIKHIQYMADDQAEAGIALRDRLFDAIQKPVKGVFAVGQQLFRSEKAAPIKVEDFKHIGGRRELPTKLSNTKYIDASGYEIVTIDSDDTVWLRKSGNTNLYKTTVDDLHSRISATTLDIASGEQRGTFDGASLTAEATGFASNMFGKVAGDGSLICVTGTEAKYLPVGASTLSTATGFTAVKGGMLTGWLFDVQDNVVLVGGYSASPNYGQGKINFSNDYGRTYKTILDLENQDVFGATATAKAHIHGCAWDKYWNRVWVVMGDYTIDSKAIGKILWCDNPQSATPVWNIEPRDMIQPSKHNEQHIAVYPMEDCILFGSDCNPSYIARRARVSKDESTYTDMALYLHNGLAYYPAQFWQHKKDLPVTIFLGSDLLDIHGDNPDGVLITYDGVNFSRIWSDKNEYSNTSGRTSSYAYALPKERFLLQKRVDPRFASGTCWVMGRLRIR